MSILPPLTPHPTKMVTLTDKICQFNRPKLNDVATFLYGKGLISQTVVPTPSQKVATRLAGMNYAG